MRARRWGVGVVATSLVTVIVGCRGDVGDGLGQTSEAIALGPGGVTEVGVVANRLASASLPSSLAAGPNGFMFTHYFAGTWNANAHVMAARLDASGALIDRPSFTLPAEAEQTGSAGGVSPLGDRWFTVFNAFPNTGAGIVPSSGAPRVDARSVVTGVAGASATACASSGCLAVGGARAIRYDAAGAPVGSPFSIGAVRPGGAASVAASATQWLAVYESTNPFTNAPDLRANRVRLDGTVLDGEGVPFTSIAATRRQPAVTSDGAGFLVAFVAAEGAGSRTPGLYVQTIDASAGVVGVTATRVAGTEASLPSVAWDGTRYWVIWQTATAAQYVRVSREGAVLDATPGSLLVSPSGQSQQPLIAAYQGRVGAVWHDTVRHQIFFVRLGADGQPIGTPTAVSYRPDEWINLALATDGTRVAMSCSTLSQPASDTNPVARAYVYGADGAPLVPGGETLIGTSPRFLFWDGARYRGFSSDGARSFTLGADGHGWSVATLSPAANASSWVALNGVYFGDVPGAMTPALRRYDADGRALDPFPIPFGGASARAFGSNGTVILGVWTDASDVTRAARINRDGDVIDVTPWDISVAGDRIVPQAIAYGGGVWAIAGNGYSHSGLRVRFVDGAGHVLRTVAVSDATLRFRIAWNGTEFVVVGARVPDYTTCLGTLRAWGVTVDGAVSPPGGVVLDDRLCGTATETALVTRTDGTSVVGWLTQDATYATHRCVTRTLSPGMGVDAGTAADAGADATVDRPDVGADTGATNDTGPADVGVTDTGPRDSAVTDAGIDVPVVMPDVPAVTDAGVTDVPAVTDAGVEDVPPAVDAPSVDVAPAEDIPVTDVATTDVPVTVDAGPTDVPTVVDVGTPDVGVATDASPVPDAGPAADTGTAPPPEDEGGCDVGGLAGGRSRSPLAASLSLLALALASRRRR